MSTQALRTIVDNLNAAPFNKSLTLVKFDSVNPDKLLQTLSDVLCWVQGSQPAEFVDIRTETPDETTMRILSTLRILKYPPPRDIDQIQKWRLDILEGNKMAIYPILEWIFENVDRLKERVYLAGYLTRVEVELPLEELNSPEVVQLMNLVEQKMEEFKAVHTRNVESRADFIRANDVRNDLKAMEEEKEQLQRKIDRCRRKCAKRADLPKYLEMAKKLRDEQEKGQELQLQKQEQENALTLVDQRLLRLERKMVEEEHRKDSEDPNLVISKLKREIEINKYLLNEKLNHDIATQGKNLEVVHKILGMRNVNKTDIDRLKDQIEQLNSEIMEIAQQRDRKDEASEDKLVVYRHQAANIERKKANVADILQSKKQELDNAEAMLAAKKRELSEKMGNQEVVTTVQYKLYVNKLRTKSNVYKRKKAEIEQAKAETQILERTLELLGIRFEQIKAINRSEGRGVIEQLDEAMVNSSQQRPKTAKPTSTNIQNLKQLIEQITAEINQRRSTVQGLNGQIEEFYRKHKDKNERYYACKTELESLEEASKREQSSLAMKIDQLEKRLKDAQIDLEKNNENVAKHKWIAENAGGGSSDQVEMLQRNLERQREECAQKIGQLSQELTKHSNNTEIAEQLEIWTNLAQVFEAKLRAVHKRNDGSKPIGDRFFN